MEYSIISFTEKGIGLSEKLAKELIGEAVFLFTKCSRQKETYLYPVAWVKERISEWTGEQMRKRRVLIFVGACGIAVRAIAPWVNDKLFDSPVIVIDEKGEYVIPILSGHMGGANENALFLAKKLGAKPVITTATDLNGKFAVDIFAKKNELAIVNKEGIAKVSAKVLAEETLRISIEPGHLFDENELPEYLQLISYPPKQSVDIVITSENGEFDTKLLLKPREYAIGMGCRKGKESEQIEAFISKHLKALKIVPSQVFILASIVQKKEEAGLISWSRKENIPFLTYTAEQLQEVQKSVHASAFVKDKVGVDNVCERAALRACGEGAKLIGEKCAEEGMTLAIAKRDWSVTFDEA